MDCENESDNMLFCKDGLQFIKAGKNTYKLTCSMENKNIVIESAVLAGPVTFTNTITVTGTLVIV